MYFHFLCDDMGYDLLAGLFKRAAIDEMMHVEKLAQRILFLKGEVKMKVGGNVQQIKDVSKMSELTSKMEQESAQEYNVWANVCAANADSATKQIFEDLVAEEERHYDQYDTEHDNLKKFGTRYLALLSIERSKNLSATGRPVE